MGTEKGPNWYTGKGYLGKFDQLRILYDRAFSIIQSYLNNQTIVDLGCGIGYFAKVLKENNYKNYIGIDFSEKVLKIASSELPEYQFIQSNLLDKKINKIFQKNEIFIALESLEHITQDIDVIQRIKKGSLIVISLPTKDYISHVRFFKNIENIEKRYNKLIEFQLIEPLIMNSKETSKVFLCKGIKK